MRPGISAPSVRVLSVVAGLALVVGAMATPPAAAGQRNSSAANSAPHIRTLAAQTAGSLSGTVRDGSGVPIQGVIVRMYSTGDTAHPVYTTPTALDGTYSVTGITSGSYLVRFTGDPDLFIDAWYPERKDPADADPITIHPRGDADAGYDETLRRHDVTQRNRGWARQPPTGRRRRRSVRRRKHDDPHYDHY